MVNAFHLQRWKNLVAKADQDTHRTGMLATLASLDDYLVYAARVDPGSLSRGCDVTLARIAVARVVFLKMFNQSIILHP